MILDSNIIIIIGAAVSVLTEIIKRYAGTNKPATLAVVLVISLVFAGVYYFVAQTNYYDTVLNILIIAGAFYAYIIKNLLPPATN